MVTVRRIMGTIFEEADPVEQRRLRRLLRSALQRLGAYRKELEHLASAAPQHVRPFLIEQIVTFLLIEDELERERIEARKSRH